MRGGSRAPSSPERAGPARSGRRAARRQLGLGTATPLAFALALALVPRIAPAGPWVPDPGHGYGKLWLRWLPGFVWNRGLAASPGDGTPGGAHAIDNPPDFLGFYQELGLGAYGEFGIARGVAATFHWMPLQTFLLQDPRPGANPGLGAHATVGEPAFGARIRLLQAGRLALGAEASVRVPTGAAGQVQDVYALREGNPRVGGLRVHSGVVEVSGGLQAGLGLDRAYLVWGAALTASGGGWDTVLLWNAEVGWSRPGGKRSTRVKLLGRHPLGDGSAPYHESPSGIGNGTAYIGFTVENDWEIAPRTWFGLSLAGGLGLVVRQIGGPVIAVSIARAI